MVYYELGECDEDFEESEGKSLKDNSQLLKENYCHSGKVRCRFKTV